MSQALYRKWRPQTWQDVVGQQHVLQSLRNEVASDRIVHAYLFSGPRGTGKTTVARLLAKAVNCLAVEPANRPCNQCEHCKAVLENRFLDLIEIDAASNTGVDDVRDLRDKINFSPNQGRYKIYIIDEVHMLSNQAFNALLKTLEEPPAHAIFVLATTEIQKIPATVLSRCQRHEFRRVPVSEIVQQLERIAKTEKMKAEPEALVQIARQSTGSLRDAISLLDQLASTGEQISLELTQAVLGTAALQAVSTLVDSILAGDPAGGMRILHEALDAGTDSRVLGRQVVDYLRLMLLIKLGSASGVDATAELKELAKKQAGRLAAADLLRLIRLFNATSQESRGSWQPALALEMALAEACQPAAGTAEPKHVSAAESHPVGTKPEGKIRGEVRASDKHPAVEIPQAAPVAKKTEASSRETPAEAKPGNTDLETITAAWRQVREEVRKENPILAGLLNSCRIMGIRKDVLQLGFSSDVLQSKMDKAEHRKAACEAIARVTGLNVSIECVISTAKKGNQADVPRDGMVAAALQAGGEIVDIQE